MNRKKIIKISKSNFKNEFHIKKYSNCNRYVFFRGSHLDHIRPFFREIHQNLKTVNKIKKCYFLRILENSTIFLRSKKFSKIPIFCSEKCSAIFKILKEIVPQISAKQKSLIFSHFQCCLEKLKGELLLWILYLIK